MYNYNRSLLQGSVPIWRLTFLPFSGTRLCLCCPIASPGQFSGLSGYGYSPDRDIILSAYAETHNGVIADRWLPGQTAEVPVH